MLKSRSFFRYAAASLAALVAGVMVASAVSYSAPTFASTTDADLESVSVDPQLKLTPEQKQKLRSIAQEYTSQVRGVLNAEQRRDLAAGLKSKKRLRDILRTLKLTKEQQNQIASARRDAGRKAFAVLTPAQQKLLSSRRN
jgi:Spy/CpxP family protein refolding chaperone